MDKREINVNVNRIQPFIASHPEDQIPETSQLQTPQPEPQVATEQKEEEQPRIEVKRKQKPIPKAPEPQLQKRGRGRPSKHMGPPKDKIIQFEPRWTRARAAQMEEERKRTQTNADANIEELIKTNNIVALIKTDQEKWDACLIKLGNAYIMDEYGLPKQQPSVQQPEWVYKRREYLKSLSVAKRNFILTGDEAFAFDPVPYTVIYHCYTYADIVRGPAPIQVVQPPQVVQNPVQVIAAPVQPPQVVQNPVQVIAAPVQPPQVVQNPVQIITAPVQPPQVVQNLIQVIAAPVQPSQVVQNPVQVIAAPVQPPKVVQNMVQVIAAPIQSPKATVIVPTIVRKSTPEPVAELDDIPELEDDSNPTSPEPPTLLQQPLPHQAANNNNNHKTRFNQNCKRQFKNSRFKRKL